MGLPLGVFFFEWVGWVSAYYLYMSFKVSTGYLRVLIV